MQKKLDKNKTIICNDFDESSKYLLHIPLVKNLPFFVNGAGHFVSRKNYYVSRSGLNMFLLIHTLSGNGELEYHDNVFLLKKNDTFLINALDYHRYNTLKSCKFWEFKWIRFMGDGVMPYYNYINEADNNFRIFSSQVLFIEKYFTEAIDLISRQADAIDFRLFNLLVNVLTELCSLKSLNYQTYKTCDAISNAKQHILNNFNLDISIKLLAESYHFNTFTFIRNFKQQVGICPYAFIMKIRINNAKLLLEKSIIPIQKIANQVGFKDTNCFIRSFKNTLDMTPLQYRRMMNGYKV